jgi:hypothetical protein
MRGSSPRMTLSVGHALSSIRLILRSATKLRVSNDGAAMVRDALRAPHHEAKRGSRLLPRVPDSLFKQLRSRASHSGVSPCPVTFPLFTKRERSAARALMVDALLRSACLPLRREARLAALLLAAISVPGPELFGVCARGGDATQLAPSARWPTTTGGRVPWASRVPACETFPRAPHPAPTSDRIATRPRGAGRRNHTRSLFKKASAS